MDTIKHLPQLRPSLLPVQNLQLAPEGWRYCVEAVAEGFAEVVGQHAYCMICGGLLNRSQGHNPNCTTMLARRILVNEPLLLERSLAQMPGVDIDAAHRATPATAPCDACQ